MGWPPARTSSWRRSRRGRPCGYHCRRPRSRWAPLLLPVVPTALAAAALTVFSSGLVGLYLRTPGMREDGSLRPTQQGVALVKYVWILGSGLGLLIDEALDEGRQLA